jgi:hypothetical protein
MRWYGHLVLTACLALGPTSPAPASEANGLAGCAFRGIELHGKVEIVESFPDIKVQVVESFPDLKVKPVTSFPDDCGEWQFVGSQGDFKVKFVESFPDVKVKMVESFPGLP